MYLIGESLTDNVGQGEAGLRLLAASYQCYHSFLLGVFGPTAKLNAVEMAGAAGIEPAITGSKPGALPLGYAPIRRGAI